MAGRRGTRTIPGPDGRPSGRDGRDGVGAASTGEDERGVASGDAESGVADLLPGRLKAQPLLLGGRLVLLVAGCDELLMVKGKATAGSAVTGCFPDTRPSSGIQLLRRSWAMERDKIQLTLHSAPCVVCPKHQYEKRTSLTGRLGVHS